MSILTSAIMQSLKVDGFKTELNNEQLTLLRHLSGRLSNEQIAKLIGIGTTTLINAISQNETMQFEIDKGRTEVAYNIVGKIIEKALDGDNQMLTLYAKTQLGWKETKELEHVNIEAPRTLEDFYKKADSDEKA